jgi:D-tyrosyl-tRNA(Tyr) deacylase
VRPEAGQIRVETLERLLDAFNAHDIDAVMSFGGDHPQGLLLEIVGRAGSHRQTA